MYNTSLCKKKRKKDPKAKIKSIVSVPSKGNCHLKEKLDQDYHLARQGFLQLKRILKVLVDCMWEIIRNLHQKEKGKTLVRIY